MRAGRAVAVVIAAAWLFGLGQFLLSDGSVTVVLPRKRVPVAVLQNLAAWDLGPTIRASSYYRDWLSQHHPLFLVDGRVPPDDLVEKWASSPSDRSPWIEILWREEHELERVTIHHAGCVESAMFTVHDYALTCIDGTGHGPTVRVTDNMMPVATHDLRCARARGLHIDLVPNGPGDVVRLFEVEALGI